MTAQTQVRQARDAFAAKADAVRFEALDSWRGLAAVMVVLFHAQIVSHFYDAPLVVAGDAFVDFFFVLSGFVIAHAYGSRLDTSEGVARFLFLRLGRLYPLHFFMIGLFAAFEALRLALPQLAGGGDPPFGAGTPPAGIAVNLLMLQSFHPADHLTWNAPSWSISAELLAYTLFALLTLFARRTMTLWLALAALAAPLALAFLSARGMETSAGFGWPRALYGFALGALLYRLAGRAILSEKRRVSPAPAPAWTLAEALAAVAAVAGAALAHGTSFAYAMPLVFALAVAVFAVEGGLFSRLLRLRPFLFLGAVSYSIYLTHLFVLTRFNNAAHLAERVLHAEFTHEIGTAARGGVGIDSGSLWLGDAALAFVLAAVIAVSWLTWRLIELPGQALFRRWCDRLLSRRARARPALAPAE